MLDRIYLHRPVCTVEQHCSACDLFRSGREVKRLQEVLRTTMDRFLDVSEEVKDMHTQRDEACQKLFELQNWAKVEKEKLNQVRKDLFELQWSVVLARMGKISVADIRIPAEKDIHYEPEL